MEIGYGIIVFCLTLWRTCLGTRPHVLFILADDYGYNDIGYHAQNHKSDMKTPFLDQLAAEGIKLENYYVQPICSPTRSQLMSGRYQIHTGLQHSVIHPDQANALPIDNTILPEQLKHCGYDTHMVGKWHLGFYEDQYLPWKRGFNSYFGYLTGTEDYYTHHRCFHSMCGVDMWSSKYGPVNNTWGEYSTHLFARKAIEAIDNRDKTKPMFLYLAYQSVHGPLQVPERYTKPFEHIKDQKRRNYGGMVLAMDESIFNVTQHLRKLKMLENTIIIFSTDNGGITSGGGNNWPLRGQKNTLWEGGVKGVGFLYGKPLNSGGITYKGMLHVSDWLPTILGATDCPLINSTKPLDGFNEWPAITQKSVPQRSQILHNIDPLITIKAPYSANETYGFDTRVRAALRSGPWKLLTGDVGFDKWVAPPESKQLDELNSLDYVQNHVRLFNIEEDPTEHHNLAISHPDMVKNLLVLLAKYNSTSVPVRYPTPDPKSNPKYHNGYWGPWIKSAR